MKVSTRGRYAMKTLTDLALCNPDEYIHLNDIACRQNISKKYLEQILPALCKAGILQTSRGPAGGYKLCKDPSEISAAQILSLTEGSLEVCHWLCDDETNADLWGGLNSSISDYLESITLDDLKKDELTRLETEKTAAESSAPVLSLQSQK